MGVSVTLVQPEQLVLPDLMELQELPVMRGSRETMISLCCWIHITQGDLQQPSV
jgi:hypothetical protein